MSKGITMGRRDDSTSPAFWTTRASSSPPPMVPMARPSPEMIMRVPAVRGVDPRRLMIVARTNS